MVLLIVPTKKFSALKEKGHIWKHHLLINSKLSSLLADCVIEDNVLECTCVSAFFEKCVEKVGLSLSLSQKQVQLYVLYFSFKHTKMVINELHNAFAKSISRYYVVYSTKSEQHS